MRYNITENDRCGNSPTEWKLIKIYFTIQKYGIKLIYIEIDTTYADKCFSEITIKLSEYWIDHGDYFKDMFESIPDFWKIALLEFIIKNDEIFLSVYGFVENEIIPLSLEFKNKLIEQNEEYLD